MPYSCMEMFICCNTLVWSQSCVQAWLHGYIYFHNTLGIQETMAAYHHKICMDVPSNAINITLQPDNNH